MSSKNKISMEVEYYDDEGWSATASYGGGKLYVYDRGYSRPEEALFGIVLELARIRAHFESGAMDSLSINDKYFEDVVKRRGIFG